MQRISGSQIAPELRQSTQRVPRIPVSNPAGRWFIRKSSQLLLRDQPHDGVRVEKLKTGAGIELRVYTPAHGLSGAGLLWIHGGGLVIGRAAQDDLFCAETARELGLTVASTEYRLAPEFPFPAALDDCYAAWSWMQATAMERGIETTCIAIGGESAGGGLAAALVQRTHDSGGVQPVAQWLFCPMLDDRTAANRELDGFDHPVWNNPQNRFGWGAYLGVEPGVAELPAYASPARRDDLRGLPPAWIGTGDIELFYEENRTYAERLAAAGVQCTLDIVPGAPHGFQTIARDTALAQAYLTRARQWLHQVVEQHSSRAHQSTIP